jgi:hypothetical protein
VPFSAAGRFLYISSFTVFQTVSGSVYLRRHQSYITDHENAYYVVDPSIVNEAVLQQQPGLEMRLMERKLEIDRGLR